MNSRRAFVIWFGIPVVCFVAIVLGLTIWQQKVTGDLTRTGRWSEREFGARQHPFPFPVRANTVAGAVPDILVLGDSFSEPNIWQTEVSNRTGLTLVTWQLDEQKSCIDSWVAARLQQYPHIKTIIIESVERKIIDRGNTNFGCGADDSSVAETTSHIADNPRLYWPLTMNLEFVGHSLLHTIQEDLRPNDEVRNEVVNVPLIRQDLFSNSRSDRLLYFTDDEPPWHASADSIATAHARFSELNAQLRAKGIRLIVLIVPDKSHVYRGVMRASSLNSQKFNFSASLAGAGVESPDFLPALISEAMSSVDLYQPDDTHLSIRGFRFLGALIAPLCHTDSSD